MLRDSLALRLVLGAGAWSLAVLLAGSFLLASLFRQSVENNFDARLLTRLEGLVATTDFDNQGNVLVDSNLSEPRFDLPFSGWYWQISRVAPGKGGEANEPLLRSRSLWDESLKTPGDSEVSSEPSPIRISEVSGPENQHLRVVERDILLPGRVEALTFMVAGARGEVDSEIASFNQTLFISLGILVIGLLAAVFIQARLVLRPLARVRQSLTNIRSGLVVRVDEALPAEIRPLAEELNKLLDHNAKVVERARTHVGNLAHALKTPLSVLANEANADTGKLRDVVARQTELMRRQVDHHLVRARAAASGQILGARTSVSETLNDLVRTLKRIYRDSPIEVSVTCENGIAFRGERQDLEEMIGNLADNAFKWARKKIVISAERMSALPSGDGNIVPQGLKITVDDDGPGLSEEERDKVFTRGERLDESVPGSGLGLAIVKDVARLYSGQVVLQHSPMGGLRALLELPASD
jgi:signal transduction histidine kinase